jgi:hypothetical protein
VAGAEEVEEAFFGDGDSFGRSGGRGGIRGFFPFDALRVRMTILDCMTALNFGGSGGGGEILGFFAPLRMTILRCMTILNGGSGGRWRSGGWCTRRRSRGWWGRWSGCGFGCGEGLEGLEGGLEGVDHLAGAAGVDGVGGEAVDDGGEGDEDGGAVFDGREFHAGDFGVDEYALLGAFGVLDVVEVAVVLAFEGG